MFYVAFPTKQNVVKSNLYSRSYTRNRIMTVAMKQTPHKFELQHLTLYI